MPELNIISAVLIGAFAAAAWATVAIRRLLRGAKFIHLSAKQRVGVWCTALLAFFPALLIGFAGAGVLSLITVRPGPWNHLALQLTFVFGLGFLGAAATWASALLVATLMRRRMVQS
jgi:hypothetical protein